MKHNFTDDQIISTIRKMSTASANNDYVANWELEVFSQFLDALPDQPDQPGDWQQCEFGDIYEGDQVHWTYNTGDTTVTRTGVAHRYLSSEIQTSSLWFTKASRVIAMNDSHSKFERIPAPNNHPDPKEHPVIVEQGGKGWVWNAHLEMYNLPGRGKYRFPDSFTEWSPAQIITDEPAEAPQ